VRASVRVPFVDLQAQHHGLSPALRAAFAELITRCDFILGSAVERFEADFARYIGARHAIGVGTGLDAIELALRAHGIGPGDEVVTAANTFIATVLAIEAVGARPVLVDVNRETYGMDPDAAAASIGPRTRALMPVHLYGHPVALDDILALARRHDLVVIEDAAQAHGARFKGGRAGAFGHAAAFSFYPAKNLGACGDGGMIVTSDDRVAEKARMLRNYGQRVKYHHAVMGTNSRLDTLQAAILGVKLPHLDGWNDARRGHARAYSEQLAGLVHTPATSPDVEHVYHLYVIETERRDEVQQHLHSHGVDTGIHYPVPVHLQEACAHLGYRAGEFPNTEAAASRILSLPMYPELTPAHIEHVTSTLVAAMPAV
jgi:dTDP-3-amino-3,4,6-trideoxy-alpha-D-glucose transaminase